LLGNFFTVGVGLDQFLQAAQLALDAGQTGAQVFFLFGVDDSAHPSLLGSSAIVEGFSKLMIAFCDSARAVMGKAVELGCSKAAEKRVGRGMDER
jgi:hypothetical protein